VTLLTRLLPNAPLLHLDAWHMGDTATQLTLQLTSTQALVPCPICRFPTRLVHSRYAPTVADPPWGPWRVVLHLQVRKFCGANGRCTRRIFTERLAPWSLRGLGERSGSRSGWYTSPCRWRERPGHA
jgi:hypothetical protein